MKEEDKHARQRKWHEQGPEVGRPSAYLERGSRQPWLK